MDISILYHVSICSRTNNHPKFCKDISWGYSRCSWPKLPLFSTISESKTASIKQFTVATAFWTALGTVTQSAIYFCWQLRGIAQGQPERLLYHQLCRPHCQRLCRQKQGIGTSNAVCNTNVHARRCRHDKRSSFEQRGRYRHRWRHRWWHREHQRHWQGGPNLFHWLRRIPHLHSWFLKVTSNPTPTTRPTNKPSVPSTLLTT